MRTKGRVALAGVLGMPALAVVAHTFYWHALSTRLEEGFEAWAASRRAQGWNVAYGAPQRGGWPLAARLDVPDLWLSGGQALVPGGMAWSAPRTALQLGLLNPGELKVEPAGAQTLRAGATEIPFTADRIAITLRIEPGVPPTDGDLEAKMLRAGLPGGGGLIVDKLHAEWQVRPAAEGEPAVSLHAEASAVTLPAGVEGGGGLGERLRNLVAEAVLTGPTAYAPDPRRRATEWRDGGGTIEVRQLGFDWGPAGLQASATLTLDDDLQPMGAATARITGAAEALRALSEAGVVPPRAARMAGAALPLMTRRGEDGTASVEVPLTLQDRTLALGRIPIARLPSWSWATPQ